MPSLVVPIQGKIPRDYFTVVELSNVLCGTEDRRYSLLKRTMARGEIIRIRRGLYCLAPPYQRHPLNLFAVAQSIYGPSYITVESALSYHGWIPESVHAVTSATSKRSREFKTPVGLFSYRRVLCDPFLAGVERIQTGSDSFFIATPWRAMADYVFIYKKDWKGIAPLLDSLRIEKEALKDSDQEELRTIRNAYQSERVRRFLKGMEFA